MDLTKLLPTIFLLFLFNDHKIVQADINESSIVSMFDITNALLGPAGYVLDFSIKVYKYLDAIQHLEKNKPEDIKKEFNKINAALNSITVDISILETSIFDKLEKQFDLKSLNEKKRDLFLTIQDIENYFKNYLRYIDPLKTHREDTIMRFADDVLSTSRKGVGSLLDTLHASLLERNSTNSNILTLLTDNKLVQLVMCPAKKSPQQLILDLYAKLVETETKGLAMVLYANQIMRNATNDHTESVEEQEAKSDLKNRMSKTSAAMKQILKMASREIWNCDPSTYIENIGNRIESDGNFARFGPIIQTYIMNEDATHLDRVNKCYKKCEDHQNVKQMRCALHNWAEYSKYGFEPNASDRYCQSPYNKKCNGNVRNCKKVFSKMTFCPSELSSTRRYEWVTTDSQTIGRKNAACTKEEVLIGSGEMGLPGFKRDCDYCICTCEENRSDINQYIDLREVTSDVHENKVITGVRFRVQNNILRIIIQQGKLIPYRGVENLQWKQTDNLVADEGLKSGNPAIHVLNWDQRTFVADEFKAELNFALTGIKFTKVKGYITLGLRFHAFDFNTGKLDVSMKSQSYFGDENSNVNTDKTNPMAFEDDDLPIFSKDHAPDTNPGKRIQLTTSSLDKDVGQNVLPFIDTQPIEPASPGPISGAGLFHKGRKGSGGFLSLKLFSHNFEPYFGDRFT